MRILALALAAVAGLAPPSSAAPGRIAAACHHDGTTGVVVGVVVAPAAVSTSLTCILHLVGGDIVSYDTAASGPLAVVVAGMPTASQIVCWNAVARYPDGTTAADWHCPGP